MKCMQRAFELGFAYCEIKDKVPDISWTAELHEFASKYDLKCADEDSAEYELNDDPVLVVYEDTETPNDGIYHCVFASDIQPFLVWNIKHIVHGWKELKESRKLHNRLRKLYDFRTSK